MNRQLSIADKLSRLEEQIALLAHSPEIELASCQDRCHPNCRKPAGQSGRVQETAAGVASPSRSMP